MGSLTNIVISFFELVEAEGRVAKRNIILIIKSLLLFYFGLFFIFIGALVGFTLLYIWLKTQVGFYTAGGVTTAILLSVGGFMLYKGKLWTKNASSTKMKVKENNDKNLQK